ncbi:MAG: GntR family transcriptional regulator [Cellvibrionales bacterium]|nr:GntR family transcriptional regulator [Cellvibrionales bacterium]
MPALGQMARLSVLAKLPNGFQLDGGEHGPLLLPTAELPPDIPPPNTGEHLEVFLYPLERDRIALTARTPKAQLGDCAALMVRSVGTFGAFLDWGIGKDLLLPKSEQAYPPEVGQLCVVHIFQDPRSGRLAASSKLHRHLQESSGPHKTGDEVDLLIAAPSKLGYKAVFGGRYLGLIHHTELGRPLQIGDRCRGRIKAVRDDGKVDLSINALSQAARDELQERILQRASERGGRLPLSDKSPAQAIYREFKASKKNFKRALAALYKARQIRIHPEQIELTKPPSLNRQTKRPTRPTTAQSSTRSRPSAKS